MIEETNEWLDIMRKIFPEMSPELRECLHRMDRRLGKKGRAPTKKENRRILHKNPTGRSRAIGVKALKPLSALPSGQFLYPKDARISQRTMNRKQWSVLL
jgi:hypothetical protein